MLERRQAVVEHGIADVEGGLVESLGLQLVLHELEFGQEGLLATGGAVEECKQLPSDGSEHGQQEDDEQEDGDALVGLRLLHLAAIGGQA